MTAAGADTTGASPAGPLGPVGWLYHRALAAVEGALLGALLFVTIGVSFIEILNRNLGWQLWDSAAAGKIVYSLTFYVGLFGAVVATRHFQHIRIDAVAPYVGPRGRTALDLLASAVGLWAAAWLAWAGAEYVLEFVGPEERFLPDKVETWWQLRWWRWPTSVAFGWMALHFAARLIGFARALISPVAPDPAPALQGAGVLVDAPRTGAPDTPPTSQDGGAA